MSVIKKVMIFVMGVVVIGVLSTSIGVIIQPQIQTKYYDLVIQENITLNDWDFMEQFIDYNNVIEEYQGSIYYGLKENFLCFESHDIVGSIEYKEIKVSYNIEFERTQFDLVIETDLVYRYRFDNERQRKLVQGFEIGDIITIIYIDEVETPAIIKTLLVLIPLVFTASLVGYLSLSIKKGD